MAIKQISVFVENRHGTLAEITEILENNRIDIRALSIADTTDYGVLRLIVSDAELTRRVLKEAGVTVTVTQVLGVEIPDVPGGFSKAVKALGSKGIDIEYTYAFLSPKEKTACVIVRVEDNAAAEAALKEAGLQMVEEARVFGK